MKPQKFPQQKTYFYLTPLAAALSIGLFSPQAFAVTCQAGFTASNPDSSYTDNGDGTVTHKPTGLVWKRCQEGQTWSGGTCTGSATSHTWSQALTLAATTNYAGQTDWRLPNIKELTSLVEECRVNPAINDTIFPKALNWHVWSSSPYASNAGSSLNVNFSEGYLDYYGRTNVFGVRLVRGGQSLAPLGASASSFTPATGTVGTTATITVTGSNLPNTLVANINGQSPGCTRQSLTATQAVFACPLSLAGNTEFGVKTDTAANGGTVLTTGAFNVVAAVPISKYALTVTVSGNGSVSHGTWNCSSGSCIEPNLSGSVTLTATPAAGNSAKWSGACASATGNTCTITMDAAKNVGVAFAAVVPSNVSKITSITANGYAYNTKKYQAFDVICKSGIYGGIRMGNSLFSNPMKTYAFRQGIVSNTPSDHVYEKTVTEMQLMDINQIHAKPTVDLLTNSVLSEMATWICN